MVTIYDVNKFPPEVERYFPFPPRPGQPLMANEIYYAVLAKTHAAIEGAAGMGKTVTCLSALLPIVKRENLTLLYAARTHTQMQRVLEELRTIAEGTGQEMTGIVLHGRASMCLNPEVRDTRSVEAMELCRLLRKGQKCKWYEGLKTMELNALKGCFTAEDLLKRGADSQICPYYLAKGLIQHCDVVALTYAHLINPQIRSLFFDTLNRDVGECIIVFDECHNIPSIAMDAMSARLSDRSLARALEECDRYNAATNLSELEPLLRHFATYLDDLRHSRGDLAEDAEIPIDKREMLEFFSEFTDKYSLDLFLLSQRIQQFGQTIRQERLTAKKAPYSSILHFGVFLEKFLQTFKDPKFIHYAVAFGLHTYYYIRCIDCRIILEPLMRARGIVSMSGTLEPIDAYLEICGFPEDTRRKVLPSPFNHNHIQVLCMRGINVSYQNRSVKLYDLLARRCVEVVKGSRGNTAIFCASYDILENFQTPFSRQMKLLDNPLYFERRNLSSHANDAMVADFKRAGHEGTKAVLVGVCGGRNSEGVDFPDVEMVTVAILGVPLARITHSNNALIDYYTRQFGAYKGKEYAYTIPGLRRANQAAGRPIRSLEDSGVIVLLDERYSYPYYRRFLSHWLSENMQLLQNRDEVLESAISRFFQGVGYQAKERS